MAIFTYGLIALALQTTLDLAVARRIEPSSIIGRLGLNDSDDPLAEEQDTLADNTSAHLDDALYTAFPEAPADNTSAHLDDALDTAFPELQAPLHDPSFFELQENHSNDGSSDSMLQTAANGSHALQGYSALVSGILEPILGPHTTRPHATPKLFIACVVVVFALTCCLIVMTSTQKKERKRPKGRQQYTVNERIIYEWDQTLQTITIYTRPPKVTESNIEVVISAKQITLGKKDQAPFLKEELVAEVNPEESSWCLSGKGELQVRLQKLEEAKWQCPLMAHRDPSRPLRLKPADESRAEPEPEATENEAVSR